MCGSYGKNASLLDYTDYTYTFKQLYNISSNFTKFHLVVSGLLMILALNKIYHTSLNIEIFGPPQKYENVNGTLKENFLLKY